MAAEKKEYYAGTIPTQTMPITAKPDGTAMSQEEVNADILNKLDVILKVLKDRL